MDKPRRRAQHLQLVHSEPATLPPPPGPRQWSPKRLGVVALGLGALGLLLWTRASDMPERIAAAPAAPATAIAAAPAVPVVPAAAPDVSQNFPEGASMRHISAVLAFDAINVGAAAETGDGNEILEPNAHTNARGRVAFRLYNRSQQTAYFALFGVDAQHAFTWFYPPLTMGQTDRTGGGNRSLPLAPVPLVELPEPMALPDNAAALTLVGVFTDAPVTIAEIKQAWQTGGAMAVQGTLHARVQSLPLNPR